jgi:hypothetical protein
MVLENDVLKQMKILWLTILNYAPSTLKMSASVSGNVLSIIPFTYNEKL